MTPAPKSRVPKGEVVDSSGKPTSGGDMSSIGAGDQKAQGGTVDGDTSKETGPQHERDKSPRIAPDLRRISSSITGSERERLLKRSNTAEKREHLKHLGPSNLASRPRQTRYNTVKIKPGSDTSENRSRNQDEPAKSKSKLDTLPIPPEEQDSVYDDLVSSGAKQAQDGALAVLQGYGTITPNKPSLSSPPGETPSSKVPKSNSSKEAQSPDQRPQVNRNTSQSTLGSQNNGRTSRPATPKIKKSLTLNVARSGSITKNIVETGGTQKMVLEQSSSSDGLAEQPSRSSDNNTGESDDKVPEGTTIGGENSGSNRKKRRRRKRKGEPQSKIREEEDEEAVPLFLQAGNKG